jgi:ComF family protein
VPLIAAHAYAGPVQHAIHRFKFCNRAELAHRLGRDVARAIKPMVLPRDSILVPVPLTAHRLVERGYNQSALLARSVAHHLQYEHSPCALVRARDGHHQVGANKAERAAQVSGAFAVASRRIDKRNVILVDDVITTGATANACIAALTAGGARVVAVAAIARVD